VAEDLLTQALAENENGLMVKGIMLSQLGKIARRKGNLNEAKRIFEVALDLYKSCIGEHQLSRHNLALAATYQLGVVHSSLGQFEQADHLLRSVLEARLRQCRDDDHDDVAIVFHAIGQNYASSGAASNHLALDFFEKESEILKRKVAVMETQSIPNQKVQLNTLVQRLLLSLYSIRSVSLANNRSTINSEIAELRNRYLTSTAGPEEQPSRRGDGGAAVESEGDALSLAAEPLVKARRGVREVLLMLQKANAPSQLVRKELLRLLPSCGSCLLAARTTDKVGQHSILSCFAEAEEKFHQLLSQHLLLLQEADNSNGEKVSAIVSELWQACDDVRSFLRSQGIIQN